MTRPHEFTARELRIVLFASALAATFVMLLATINAAPARTEARDKVAVDSPAPSTQGAVTAIVVSLQSAPETATPPSAEGATKPSATAQAKDTHGTAVKEVAKDHTRVGGTHRNHGGAVSPIAREPHDGTATHRKLAGDRRAAKHPVDR